MTNEKFTQGEWKHCIFGGECGYPLVFEKKTGLRVASIFIQNGDTENGIANAALIATAPEMYRKLNELKNIFITFSYRLLQVKENKNAEQWMKKAMEIEKLLKKARGEE